jgi:hypothetical protein
MARISEVFGAMPSSTLPMVTIARRLPRGWLPPDVANSATDAAEYFLSVIFPAAQMLIMDYNRVVRDLNGLTEERISGCGRPTLHGQPGPRSR